MTHEKPIEDRILRAIADMRNSALRNNIRISVACRDEVLGMALGAMVSSGLIQMNQNSGRYSLTTKGVEALSPASEVTMGDDKRDGKKCTFCEDTKDRKDDFYANQGRCKLCMNRIGKVNSLKKQGKPIPSDLKKYDVAGPASSGTKAKRPAVAAQKKAHVPASSEPFRIIPANAIECCLLGHGAAAEAHIIQSGRVHIYGMKELEQLVGWASGVLKRGQAA